MARALDEEELRIFLQRQRRAKGLVEPPPVAQWIAHTLELTSRLVPCEAGSLLLDDPTRKGRRSPLTFVAAFGPTADEVVGVTVPAGKGIAGHVYRTGEQYTTDQPREDPAFFAQVDQIGGFQTRSVLAVPLRLEQEVCGVLELVNRRGPVGFGARDVELAELLAQYISRAILNAVDILKQNYLALHDDLTGVRNVRGLHQQLDAEAAEAEAAGRDLAVLFVDVDRLKRINDRHGHAAGSLALREVGRAIAETLQDRGTAFRFGGDEFVVVCPGFDADAGEALADELRGAVERATRRASHRGPPVSVSVGVATLATALRDAAPPRHRGHPPATAGMRLLAAADKALYRAKDRGRNRTSRATRRDDTLDRRKR